MVLLFLTLTEPMLDVKDGRDSNKAKFSFFVYLLEMNQLGPYNYDAPAPLFYNKLPLMFGQIFEGHPNFETLKQQVYILNFVSRNNEDELKYDYFNWSLGFRHAVHHEPIKDWEGVLPIVTIELVINLFLEVYSTYGIQKSLLML
jgi:hypothetical protein